MPNGREVLNNLEFERLIKEKSDRELMEFTARQVLEIAKNMQNHGKRIDDLEAQGKKAFAITGGVSSVIGGIIVAIVNYIGRYMSSPH